MKKFGRKTDQRRAFLKSLAVNLIMKSRIKTTEERAKELRLFLEPLISKAKLGSLTARRAIAGVLPSAASSKLFKEVAPGFKGRNGGYVRLVKIGQRMSDGAKMVFIELIK